MKANELMIGDRIRFKYLPRHDDEIFDGVVNSQMFLYPSDFEIIPIPITAEILEKNGFEKRNRYQWEYRDGYCKIVISIAPKIEIDGEILGPPPIDVEIEGALFELNKTDDWYVHELQHALKLCGIEKEITI